MTNDDGRKPEGAPERSPKALMGAPSGPVPRARRPLGVPTRKPADRNRGASWESWASEPLNSYRHPIDRGR